MGGGGGVGVGAGGVSVAGGGEGAVRLAWTDGFFCFACCLCSSDVVGAARAVRSRSV